MIHHAPACEAEQEDLVAVAALADGLTNRMQLTHNLIGFAFEDSAAHVVLRRICPGPRVEQLQQSLPEW